MVSVCGFDFWEGGVALDARLDRGVDILYWLYLGFTRFEQLHHRAKATGKNYGSENIGGWFDWLKTGSAEVRPDTKKEWR